MKGTFFTMMISTPHVVEIFKTIIIFLIGSREQNLKWTQLQLISHFFCFYCLLKFKCFWIVMLWAGFSPCLHAHCFQLLNNKCILMRTYLSNSSILMLYCYTSVLFTRGFWSRARIFKHLMSPRIDSKESIPAAYVAWAAGTTTLFLLGS